MNNLSDFVADALAERDDTISAFASRIGTTRQTVARWSTSLPGAETLRRVAADLDVPYSQVLVSALVSAGYVETPADVLAGQDVHAVIETDPYCPSCGGGVLAGVFSDSDTAGEFARVSHSINREMSDFESAATQIDSVSIPEAIEIHTHSWSSQRDELRHGSVLVGERPARLFDRDISDIEVSTLGDDGQVFALRVSSIEDSAGRNALLALLDEFRKAGKLLPPDVNPHAGRPSSLLAEAALAAQRYYADLYGDAQAPQVDESQLDGLSVPPPAREPAVGDTTVVGDRTFTVTHHGMAVSGLGPDVVAIEDVEHLPGFAGWHRPHRPQSPMVTIPEGTFERVLGVPYIWGASHAAEPAPPRPPRLPVPSIRRYTVAAPTPAPIAGMKDLIV